MRIAGQVCEDMLGVLDGLFGVDHPLFVAQGGEEPLPGCEFGEFPTATRQSQVALRVGLCKAREVEVPEVAREDTDGQEEVSTTWHPPYTIGSHASGGQDTMQMGVMVGLLAPGVQHGKAANRRAGMLGVSGNVLEGLRHSAKEQPIEQARVLERQG